MEQVEAVSHYSGANLQKGRKRGGYPFKSYRWSHVRKCRSIRVYTKV